MPRRRGLGLTRSLARTAAIAGTATAVSGRVAHSQQRKFASEAAHEGARPPASELGHEMVGDLRQLAELKAAGALSEKEFAAAKAKLLSQ
jgi:Short C-terminal domain